MVTDVFFHILFLGIEFKLFEVKLQEFAGFEVEPNSGSDVLLSSEHRQEFHEFEELVILLVVPEGDDWNAVVWLVREAVDRVVYQNKVL